MAETARRNSAQIYRHAHMHEGSPGAVCLAKHGRHPRGFAAGLDRAVVGPILATVLGFSTGIQNQLAVLYCLSCTQSEGKNEGRFIIDIWRERGARHKHSCISFSVFMGQFVIVNLTDQ